MKRMKILFNKLFNCEDNNVNDINQQMKSAESNCKSDDKISFKSKFRSQNAQDSFRELLLMCMEPFI